MVNLARPRDWGESRGHGRRPGRWVPLGLAAAGFLAAIVTTLGGSGGSGDDGGVPAFRPGDPAVYARIAAATDCAALQDELNRAELTRQQGDGSGPTGTAYREATETRMGEVGCY
jgi:hypothetical protein